MARIRSIHPGIFTDEAYMSASATARVMLFGLWCEALDDGIFEWKPITLKARLLPADNVDPVALLEELETLGFLCRFEVEGKVYGGIRNFCRYQRPKTPKYLMEAPEVIQAYVGMTGERPKDGPMTHPRDVTATERKRHQRERSRQNRDTSGSVTPDEGGRRKEEERLHPWNDPDLGGTTPARTRTHVREAHTREDDDGPFRVVELGSYPNKRSGRL